MSAYNELIKNFERVRAYMREFYVYGFKSRDEYNKKSARSYDDERRRIESWLGDHMGFVSTAEGKNVFISIDSRTIKHNPFYKAWKAKSFTDGDITLHFIIFDILHSTEISLTVSELLEIIDEKYLSAFDTPMMFDESTVRKKLREYAEEGIIITGKQGKKLLYRRAENIGLQNAENALHFYSETAPCGVIGSFLLDKGEHREDILAFKHHYITSAMDSGVMAELFTAIRQKREVTVLNYSRKSDFPAENRIVPLRIFMSVQGGRQHLLAYHSEYRCIQSFRLDYLSDVKLGNTVENFDEYRAMLDEMQTKMWGVSPKRRGCLPNDTEHVEFTVTIEPSEDFIIDRLIREKRCGSVEKLDELTYKFSADVYDISELIPWIRTFICRITELSMTNKVLEQRFKDDIKKMYAMYGIDEEEQI